MVDSQLDELLTAAAVAPFRGWDFSWLGDRYRSTPPRWDYRALVAAAAQGARSLLDMGTGGGELLATIDALPPQTVATESHPPNWSIAACRLAPLGIPVVAVEPCPNNSERLGQDGMLPFRTESIELVINRHDAYSPIEVARVLKPGGLFITQQVGGEDEAELLDWFNRPPPTTPVWNLDYATRQLKAVGLEVADGAEAHLPTSFADVGALAYYLLAVPWQVPDFNVTDDYDQLAQLHSTVETTGHPLQVTAHRFWLTATKPELEGP